MQKFIKVHDTTGLALLVFTAEDGAFTDGQAFGGDGILVEVLLTDDDVDLLTNKYYHHATSELRTKPAQPSIYHGWDLATESWVLDDLDEAKTLKRREMRTARLSAESGGFTLGGYVFDSGMADRDRIRNAAMLAASDPNFIIDWVLADDTLLTLNNTNMVLVGLAMVQHMITCHLTHRARLIAIAAATTGEEVEAIVW